MTNEYNPDGKEIRFIDSHYKDLFHIPDGSCVQIHYPDEMVVKPCTFNDYIQLPPLKKDTPSDVVTFMWEYMKVPEDSREKVKNLLKDANENGVKLSHQAPTLYDVVPKEEITEFEELMRKTIADIVSEASSVACWVYVQKYVKHKTLNEMLQELPDVGQFILAMNTWFEKLMEK